MAKTGRPRGHAEGTEQDLVPDAVGGGVELPARAFGSDTTVHDWFQRFVQDGVFERLWAVLIDACAELQGEVGVAGVRRGHEQGAFLGGLHRQSPSDRAKPAFEADALASDEDGGPLKAIIAPANARISTRIDGVIEAVVVDRPNPKTVPQNLCLDKGFDTPNARELKWQEAVSRTSGRSGEEN